MSGQSPDSADRRLLGEQQRIDAIDSKVDSKVQLEKRTPEENDKLTQTYLNRTMDLRGRLRDLHQTVLVRMDMRADWQPLKDACHDVGNKFQSLLSSVRTGEQLLSEQQQFNAKIDEFLATLQQKEQQTRPNSAANKKQERPLVNLGEVLDKTPKNTQELFDKTLPALSQDVRNTLSANAEKQYGQQKIREVFARVTLVNRLSPELCQSLYGVTPPISIAEVASQMGQDINGTAALERSPNAFLVKRDVASDVRIVRQRILDDALPLEQEWTRQQERLQKQNKLVAEALKRSSNDANAAYLNGLLAQQRTMTTELAQLRGKLQVLGQRAGSLDLAITLGEERLTRLSGGSLEADRVMLHLWEKYGSSIDKSDPTLANDIRSAKSRLRMSGTLTPMEHSLLAEDEWEEWNKRFEEEHRKNPHAIRPSLGHGAFRPNESVRTAVNEQRETGTDSFIRRQVGPGLRMVGERADDTAKLVRREEGASEPKPPPDSFHSAPLCGFGISSFGPGSDLGISYDIPVPDVPQQPGQPRLVDLRERGFRMEPPKLYRESRDRSRPSPINETLYTLNIGMERVRGVAFDRSALEKMQRVPAGMTLVLTRKPSDAVQGETWKESSMLKRHEYLETLATIRSYERLTADDLAFAKLVPGEGQEEKGLWQRDANMLVQKDAPKTGQDTNAKIAEAKGRKLSARESLNLEQRGIDFLTSKFGGKALGDRIYLIPSYGDHDEERVAGTTLVEVDVPPYKVRCTFDGKTWQWSEVALTKPPQSYEAGVVYGDLDPKKSNYEAGKKINELSTGLLDLSVAPRQHLVVGAAVEKQRQERSRDVLRALDQDKATQAVVGAAGRMQQHLGLLQEVLNVHQSGKARNRPEAFVQEIKGEAREVIAIMEDPGLFPSLIKTLGTLRELKKVVTTGGHQNSEFETELDERIKSLEQFSEMITKGEVKQMCAALLDRSSFYDDSWAEWLRVNAPKIIAGAVIVTAVLLSWGTASPLVVAVLIAGTSLAVNEVTSEAERHYYRNILGDKYYQGGSLMGSYLRRREEYVKNGENGQPPSFLNEVLEPYAKEFFINLGVTLATMGIGAQIGKAMSALAQRSNLIQGGINRIPGVNKLATWMSRHENALLNPKHPPWVMEYLKGVGTTLRDGILAQPAMEKMLEKGSEELFGQTMDGVHQYVAPVATVLLIAACHFRPKRTVQVKTGTLGEFTYNVKGVRPEEAMLQTKQLLAERGFLAQEGVRPGEFIVTHPEGHTFTLVPETPAAGPKIKQSPQETQRRNLLRDVQQIVRELPPDSPKRLELAGELTGLEITPGSDRARAISKAHEVGQRPGRDFEKEPFTKTELREKARILRIEGKFEFDQIDVLMRSGIAGLQKEMPVTMGNRLVITNEKGGQNIAEFVRVNPDGTVCTRRQNEPPRDVSIMDVLRDNNDLGAALSIKPGAIVKVMQMKQGGGADYFDYEYRGVTGDGQVHLYSPRSKTTKTVALDTFLAEHPEIQCRLVWRSGAPEPAPAPGPQPEAKVEAIKLEPTMLPVASFGVVEIVGKGRMMLAQNKDATCVAYHEQQGDSAGLGPQYRYKSFRGDDGKFYLVSEGKGERFEVRFPEPLKFPVEPGKQFEFQDGTKLEYVRTDERGMIIVKSATGLHDYILDRVEGRYQLVSPRNTGNRYDVYLPSERPQQTPYAPYKKFAVGDRLCVLRKGTDGSYILEEGWVFGRDTKTGEARAYNEKSGVSKPFDESEMVHAKDAFAGRLPERMSRMPEALALQKRQEFLNKNSTLPEQEFLRLFSSKDMKQQNVGNCYLVSAMHSLGRSPQFEALIRTSIKQCRDPQTRETYYEVKIPLGDPSAKPIEVRESDFMDPTRTYANTYHPLEGPAGWKILEAAYTLKVEPRDAWGQPNRKATEGGYGGDALQVLLGHNKTQNTWTKNGTCEKPFSAPEGRDKRVEVEHWLDSYFPGKDVATANTPRRGSDMDTFPVRDVNGQTWDVHYTHAYSVIEVNRTGQPKTVTVVNPHDTKRQRITMTYDTFMKTFSDISSVRLDATAMFNSPSSNGRRQ